MIYFLELHHITDWMGYNDVFTSILNNLIDIRTIIKKVILEL